jgi:23S rRNA pseudouridine2605 synthase
VVDDRALARLADSIEIDGRRTARADVVLLRVEGDKSWVQITLKEGRNRQVRRMGEAAGLPVMRLTRSEFAGIDVGGLRPGQWRHLTRDELVSLKQSFGVPKKIHAGEVVPRPHGQVDRRRPVVRGTKPVTRPTHARASDRGRRPSAAAKPKRR